MPYSLDSPRYFFHLENQLQYYQIYGRSCGTSFDQITTFTLTKGCENINFNLSTKICNRTAMEWWYYFESISSPFITVESRLDASISRLRLEEELFYTKQEILATLPGYQGGLGGRTFTNLRIDNLTQLDICQLYRRAQILENKHRVRGSVSSYFPGTLQVELAEVFRVKEKKHFNL